MRPPVYLDSLATTPCLPEVVEAMLPYCTERFHNPQSAHPPGEEALEAIETARAQVAFLIGAATPRDVVFTSGASESNNWAVKGVATMARSRGRHLITSRIEHASVLEPCRALERDGFEVTYLEVDEHGLVDPENVRAALRPDTALVSVTHASGELGTIEPIAAVGQVCREAKVPFHVDASNTAGNVPVDVTELNADLLTLSPHMFYGPKGVAALYTHRGVRPRPLMAGGGQEDGRRPGTENVPLIVGMGRACALAQRDMQTRVERLLPLRDRLLAGLEAIQGVRVTGHRTQRLPHQASCLVEHVDGESILLSLIVKSNLYAASGSACSSRSGEPSHVLESIGLGPDVSTGALVFGLGIDTTVEEIDFLFRELPPAIERLRALSPFA
jgi:cysteine desulfurase